ncbi:gibberellin 3-beta-dioxygenase 2-like [Malania oleifera]|uniref:gibberellin 3-beta-dioxygenase 2-like n=1 Tax=Malania oleifera TaxID=397392 RepID=UPI0025AE0509|nr:gibberellin 3-beta-dioxygenase 2-like [Malania oleifera]
MTTAVSAGSYKAEALHSGLKVLELGTLNKVPESQVWNDEEGNNYKGQALEDIGAELLPLIDLAKADAPKLVEQSCKRGVFRITNHGIPLAVLRNMESASVDLFSLPTEQKMKGARAPDSFTGYGIFPISSHLQKHLWSESFTVFGSPLRHARQIWPQSQEHSKFCDVVEEYKQKMRELALRLWSLILETLCINNDDIEWAGPNRDFEGFDGVLNLNFYPLCPEPERAMGLAPHTDSSLITLVHQNDANGLQLFVKGTGWVPVPAMPDALIVFVGDLLQIMSNGLYRSRIHQAVVNHSQHRYSFAYIAGPPRTAQIGPHPKIVGPYNPPLYPTMTWSEYLGIKAKLINDTLSSIELVKSENDSAEMEIKEP